MDIKDINFAMDILSNPQSGDASDIKEAFRIAIESLKASKEALEQQSTLDKIRAEIKALSNANPSYWHCGDMVERDEVLDIIDEYKAESEVKE